ncbi:MAG: DNA-3-methyladenine glycosylase [Actinobacteria bacterium]|nr:MAG: DNA-3-methyladenine glycosylase [Actinomycetota bacterium]
MAITVPPQDGSFLTNAPEVELVRLARDFFARDTALVARDLLGVLLVHETPAGRLTGRIVETEAYYGPGDEASHAAAGPTARSGIMFGPPGIAYVYLNYGIHNLLNVVTEPERSPGAVLIRAVEPLEGIGVMGANRGNTFLVDLANGPGKLTKAMGITLKDNGRDLTDGSLTLRRGAPQSFTIATSRRVGISRGTEAELRFFVEGSEFVSRGSGKAKSQQVNKSTYVPDYRRRRG